MHDLSDLNPTTAVWFQRSLSNKKGLSRHYNASLFVRTDARYNREVLLVLLLQESLISSVFGRYKRIHMGKTYWKPRFTNSPAYGIPVFYRANLTLDYWVGWNNFSSFPCKIQRELHLPFSTLLTGNNYCWWMIKISFLLPLTSCWTRELLPGLIQKPPSLTDLRGSAHHCQQTKYW